MAMTEGDILSASPGYTLEVVSTSSPGYSTGEMKQSSKKFTGRGRATYPLEEQEEGGIEIYEGEFVCGVREGSGTYTYKNGDMYVGEFAGNKKSGMGSMEFAVSKADGTDATRGGGYYGEYVDGAREGSGVYIYKNGDSYKGQWHKGRRHGQGTYTNVKDGSTLSGDWLNGEMRTGRWHVSPNLYLAGNFRANKPTGLCVWVVRGGCQVMVEYMQKVEPIDDQSQTTDDNDGSMEDAVKVVDLKLRNLGCVAVREE
eukprot:GHVQ01014781.1.p1 GENE.GHVQ01014781.1~~GHVQ01014781.1.p1  ORF type:complete len:256 (+),score=43.31 GHVQ01014781.1:397-1164(+)